MQARFDQNSKNFHARIYSVHKAKVKIKSKYSKTYDNSMKITQNLLDN